jgi:hypothetical protein
MSKLKDLLHDLLNEQDMPLEQAMDKYLRPTYRQRTNGHWDDRGGVTEHMAHLRAMSSTRTSSSWMRSPTGSSMPSGTSSRSPSATVAAWFRRSTFGELDADGRFSRVEETTLMLEGAESDRGIGSAR